ncbi:MAG: dCMP deaminase family protein [Methylococcales bacterium]|nr:dCMP deaminase family protein [Methylococcales bacterium]
MKKENYMSWSSYFMSIALLSSFRSKDPKTQNGACIVDKHHKIIGIGYNGLPRGCCDDDPHYWEDDDNDLLRSKHTYVVHAEKNAIYNCMAHDINHATIYVTQFPCNTCAQAIIQVGIKEVIFLRKKKYSHHTSLNQAVDKMFTDSSVNVVCYKTLDIEDTFYLDALEKTQHLYT